MRNLLIVVGIVFLSFSAHSQDHILINGQGAYAFVQPQYQDGNLISGTLVEDSRFEVPLFTPQGQSFVTVHFQRGTKIIFTYILPPMLGGRMMIGYPIRGTLSRDFIMTLEGLRARAVFRSGSEIEFQYRVFQRGELKYEYALIREGVLRGSVSINAGNQERLLVQGMPVKFHVISEIPLPVLSVE